LLEEIQRERIVIDEENPTRHVQATLFRTTVKGGADEPDRSGREQGKTGASSG
jgi:hypothetical protein